jgi:hypothetical protein
VSVGERRIKEVNEKSVETKREVLKEVSPRHASTAGHGLLSWIVKKLLRR